MPHAPSGIKSPNQCAKNKSLELFKLHTKQYSMCNNKHISKPAICHLSSYNIPSFIHKIAIFCLPKSRKTPDIHIDFTIKPYAKAAKIPQLRTTLTTFVQLMSRLQASEKNYFYKRQRTLAFDTMQPTGNFYRHYVKSEETSVNNRLNITENTFRKDFKKIVCSK